MKLRDIINETTADFVVYQVSSPKTDSVYYGYGSGDIKSTFLGGAGREHDPDRGDVRMLQAAGGPENLNFKMVDVFSNEIEAFMERNDLRARDSHSITGPTNFPAAMYQRAKSLDPERVKNWRMTGNINTMSAREAMSDEMKHLAKFKYDDIKALVIANPKLKSAIVADLDNMLYPDFVKKYFPTR